jgi:hypothetical protein
MPFSAWFPAGFLVLALAGSLTVLFVRGRTAWRAFSSFSSAAELALDEINASAASAEQHAAAFAAASERLEHARARLSQSLAELAVLRAAADEVRARIKRTRGLVPHKARR